MDCVWVCLCASLRVCACMLICGLILGVCSAGATRCCFIWFNEILTKLFERSFAFHSLSYTCRRSLNIRFFCGCVCECVGVGFLFSYAFLYNWEFINILAKCMHTLFSNIPNSTFSCHLVQMLNERHVMVRVGGGWETFISYLQKHDPCRGSVGRSEVRICRDKAKPHNLNISPDSYMVVGAHYRSKK